VSRPTRGRSRALPVRGCHPLWPAFPDGSGCRTIATGLVRVRSPLLTESLLMSFPPGTEMFQFPGFASYAYGFSARYRRSGGFPHSDIRGSKLVRNSPRLFAAYHVLHRLRVPRHPPNALKALDRSHCLMPALERRGAGMSFTRAGASRRKWKDQCHTRFARRRCGQAPPARRHIPRGNVRTSLLFTMSEILQPRLTADCETFSMRVIDGGARRVRTDDLLLAKQALSQLSYGPVEQRGRPSLVA
jgi:hypothetical protein